MSGVGSSGFSLTAGQLDRAKQAIEVLSTLATESESRSGSDGRRRASSIGGHGTGSNSAVSEGTVASPSTSNTSRSTEEGEMILIVLKKKVWVCE